MTGYTLTPLDGASWLPDDIRDAGYIWFWCDLHGHHVDAQLPERCPATSHLWGWRPQSWIRLRLDGETVIGAVLRLDGAGSPDAVPAEIGAPVVSAFRAPAGGVATPSSVRVELVRTLPVLAPVSLTFVELALSSADDSHE